MKFTTYIYQNLFKKPTKNAWWALSILLVSLVLTIALAMYVKNRTKREFESVCNELQVKVSTRLHAHAQLVRSAAAFIESSDSVTRREWSKFYERSRISTNLQGIQGLEYVQIIHKQELQQHIQKIRNEGFSDYTVKPGGDRALYSTIVYVEPFIGRNMFAFGYDMLTEPVRRTAMELARDSDLVVISGKVVLVQETAKDVQAGVLMYVPVYRNGMQIHNVQQCRAAIKGWICSAYRMNNMMLGILGERRDIYQKNNIHLQIFDDSISTRSLLYNSERNDKVHNAMVSRQTFSTTITFNGKRWVLLFSQPSTLYSQRRFLFVLFCGFIISCLLFALFYLLFNTNQRAVNIAQQLTLKLIHRTSCGMQCPT